MMMMMMMIYKHIDLYIHIYIYIIIIIIFLWLPSPGLRVRGKDHTPVTGRPLTGSCHCNTKAWIYIISTPGCCAERTPCKSNQLRCWVAPRTPVLLFQMHHARGLSSVLCSELSQGHAQGHGKGPLRSKLQGPTFKVLEPSSCL